MTIKSELRIAPIGTGDPLPAMTVLSALKSSASHHEKRDCRHPLGVYNLSVHRICDKVGKCADRLSMYWTNANTGYDVKEEIIDYLELSMYSAAEHVDDIERIASTFFSTDSEASRASEVQNLKRAIKPLRDEISNFTNMIKHGHGRIRLFEVEFSHEDTSITLLGFFIEGFKYGGVLPNPILHGGGKVIISVTSHLWSIIIYITLMSEEISTFVRGIGAHSEDSIESVDAPKLRETAIKLSRLPLYSFDDEHPFERVRVVMTMDDAMKVKAESPIYGSLCRPWSKSKKGGFGQSQLLYEGDGITRTFRMAQPQALRLQHWDSAPGRTTAS